MVLLVDLEGAGMSNLEVELLPFFMDLLKNHFPGMVGGVFCLNYGWASSGMWQLVKRVLPQTALDRILFPNQDELREFFEEEHLLIEHGGSVQYDYIPPNPVVEKYGQPLLSRSRPSSAHPSGGPTPSVSSTSLHTDVFHSAPNSQPGTPSLSRRHSGVALTPAIRSGPPSASTSAPGWPWSWTSRAKPPAELESGGGLRRVRSFAELHKRLEETQREIGSDISISDSASEEADEGSMSVSTTAAPSARSSRFSSRATSRESSPSRRRAFGPLTLTISAAVSDKVEPHVLSPYNASNPHFGYPAYLPSSSLDASGIPRPHHFRRRKRDLIRTLTYLAALRFLSLHRAIRYRLSVLVAALLRVTGLGWCHARTGRLDPSARHAQAASSKNDKRPSSAGPGRKVHWAQSTTPSSTPSSATSSSSSLSSTTPHQPHFRYYHASPSHSTGSSPPFLDIDPTFFYLALLCLFIRTPRRREKLKVCLRFVVMKGPLLGLRKCREAALLMLLGRKQASGILKQEKMARV